VVAASGTSTPSTVAAMSIDTKSPFSAARSTPVRVPNLARSAYNENSTWVFAIAWHKALRALERQPRGLVPLTPEAEDLPAVERGSIEDRDWLRRGLDRLTPEHRLVVELTFFAGCSYVEIAEIAGCPVNTVKTRMFHARRRLKAGLAVAVED